MFDKYGFQAVYYQHIYKWVYIYKYVKYVISKNTVFILE